MSDCIIKLQYCLDELAPSQRRVAEYLIDNAAGIIGMPIEQVSAACETSNTTVVRLCKQLGYKGYKGLCNALSADLALGGIERFSYEELHQRDDLRAILQNATAYAQAAIADTMRVLHEEDFARVVQAMIGARRVDFYGIGSSGLVAQDAQLKWLRSGKYAQTSADTHTQIVLAASLEPTDVAVLFSYSGETTDTLDTLLAVRETGAMAVSVTRYGNNRLARAADCPLYVASPEKQVRIGAMSSRMAMMHMVDLLFSAYTAQSFDITKPLLDKTLLAVHEKRDLQRGRSKRGGIS